MKTSHNEATSKPLSGSRPSGPSSRADGAIAPQQGPQYPDNGPEVASLVDDLQRTRADFENYRKQVEIQREQAKSMAVNATVLKLLPLLDDIDRAILAYPEQLGSLKKSFEKSLDGLKLVKINTEPGVDFNPDFHDAISMDDAEGVREVIAETLRPGYLYEGEVLRPAMVRVTHTN